MGLEHMFCFLNSLAAITLIDFSVLAMDDDSQREVGEAKTDAILPDNSPDTTAGVAPDGGAAAEAIEPREELGFQKTPVDPIARATQSGEKELEAAEPGKNPSASSVTPIQEVTEIFNGQK
jgi:hypothetical protein